MREPRALADDACHGVHGGIADLLESARRAAARKVNALMTATYWEIGRRIVEFEQSGHGRAEYGQQLLVRLADDLVRRFGRGFGWRNLAQMRAFYLAGGGSRSAGDFANSVCKILDGLSVRPATARRHPLLPPPLVRLCAPARHFYETEALRCGWSVRQLDRQIDSQFYQRLDDYWFRVDLLLFHRRLRCLVGARDHWTKPGENPPVGLILCADRGSAEAHYALDGLPQAAMAAEYRTLLPDTEVLARELRNTRAQFEERRIAPGPGA